MKNIALLLLLFATMITISACTKQQTQPSPSPEDLQQNIDDTDDSETLE